MLSTAGGPQIVNHEEFSMAKRSRGRPRKFGDREANGRLVRSNAPDRGTDERGQQAARLLGETRPGVDLDDALAVLAHLGHITQEQAAAGTDYAQAHRALYGEPWVGGSDKPRGRSLSANDGARLEAKVARGMKAIGTAGGNAVTICRSVCIARLLPGWAEFGPVITLRKIQGKISWVGAADRDRQKLRAMRRELPALKRGLDALVRARFGARMAEAA